MAIIDNREGMDLVVLENQEGAMAMEGTFDTLLLDLQKCTGSKDTG